MENKDNLKKFFDSKEYSTAIVGNDDNYQFTNLPEDKITLVIDLLTNPDNKELKEEALLTLKKDKGGDVLISAINSPKAKKNKHHLIAACWESEINFSNHLDFFVELALNDDYFISLEAITVIENMEGPFKPEAIKEGIKKVKAKQKTITTEKAVLLNDLTMTLEAFLKKEN